MFSTQVSNHINKTVEIYGWVVDIRDLGNLAFLKLKDREGVFQVTVLKKECPKEVPEIVKNLTKESLVKVKGKVQSAPKAELGYEIIPEHIEIISKAQAPLPLDTSGKIESELQTRLDNRFLDLRSPKQIAIFRIRSKIIRYMIDYMDSVGFIHINTPKITIIGLESGADVFKVDYYGRVAVLAQSPQLYKQMMQSAGFFGTYEMGVVFRAEKSHTTRHLTEFTGFDFEMSFINDENDVMDMEENMLKYVVSELEKNDSKDLTMLKVPKVNIQNKFPRITMEQAKKMIKEKYGKVLPEKEDLDAEGEKMIGEIVKEKYNSDFVFITEFPFEKRPFYHMLNEKGLTKSFDLLWNGVEITTGAQREHNYEKLLAQAEMKGIDVSGLEDYMKIFRFGCPPHGGIGIGIDRIVKQLTGLENVKEAVLFPRDVERLRP